MPRKQDDMTIHTALLLLQEIIEQTEGEAGVGELRQMIARSAMGLPHEDRYAASVRAHELLEMYVDILVQPSGIDDVHSGYDWEPVYYDERLAQVWREGVRQRKSVLMKYRSEKPETTERLVDPWATSTPYGIGWCHLRGASRKFRFDRISNIELTDQSFEKPENWKSLV